MKKENFKLFVKMLRLIENEELKGNKINDLISSAIDNFYPDMTEEQKRKLRDEFLFYMRKKDVEPEFY
jgi:DNA-binding ferritin-like protein (Dps family)